MHYKPFKPNVDSTFSKDSRVVKGDGLKHRCICFVGSNPTSCTNFFIKIKLLNNFSNFI